MNRSVSVVVETIDSAAATPRSFASRLRDEGLDHLRRASLATLQVNLGRLCNQACEHCHVDAGPKRTEIMSPRIMGDIVEWCRVNHIRDIDITGGAPEMNPGFREFVDQCLAIGAHVTVRCNLTILTEDGYRDLPEWYARRAVALVCSLPCYSSENVDRQRGKGVYQRSIDAMLQLNAAGYARTEGLTLDLVYNPGGAFLPPAQDQLEADYKSELKQRHGIVFNRLLALANLPINRFARYLRNNGQLESYQATLRDAFNGATIEPLMCRHLLSVDWQGHVYDCDFNQMLDMPVMHAKPRPKLWDLSAADLENRPVAVADHCFGCTAGAGSSCGGSLTD